MAHDPASGIVNKLKRKGFDFVVLPRYTYRSGSFPDALPPKGDDIINWTRMYDCYRIGS